MDSNIWESLRHYVNITRESYKENQGFFDLKTKYELYKLYSL